MSYPKGPTLVHPQWCRSSWIYQINVRQFTPAGTLTAAAAELPRIAALGVDIVWLMPVHEIGALHRKGTLGSPYAVRDFYSVGAEFGTKDDLRAFVGQAHALGLKVLLDWVANHTSWDSVLLTTHRECYDRDENGRPRPTPWYDWSDIVDLDYGVPATADYMVEAMAYWVRDFDVDGFRCDSAGLVPTWCWVRVRQELERIKPVFLLGEWESRELHDAAFDMTYGWSWNSALHQVAMGEADVDALRTYYAWNDRAYPRDSIRMLYVSNHDMNSSVGTEFEQFGDALEAAVVLSVVSDGMPLIYNGQEAGNERRLAFFDRDPIIWRDHPMRNLYSQLLRLKAATRALDNGAWGARMQEVRTSDPQQVLAFVRHGESDGVLAVLNFSDRAREVELLSGPFLGQWRPASVEGDRRADLPAAGLRLDPGSIVALPAWGWAVLRRG